MSQLIKICGLSRAEHVVTAMEAGADMIGLVIFPKSPRFVTFEQGAALADIARGRARIVTLVVDPADELLAEITRKIRPDMLQLHGGESIARVREIRARFGVPVMKAIGIMSPADVALARTYACHCDRLLFDAKPPKDAKHPGGNGLAFDWDIVADLDPPLDFMLSGGLDLENVGEAIRLVRPAGIDLSSGVEIAPGVKDSGKIKAFIAAVRAAYAECETK